MEKLIDFVELPANITLTFFEENPVYFWTGILSVLMIVWVGKLIIEKSKPKSKFKIDDRVQYAGKIGTIVRYDRKHFLPYVVWFDDGTSDQFEELTLKPVKLKWVKPKTCTELELNQEVKICSDLEQSEEGGKIYEIFSKEPKVTVEFEDYWSSRFLNLKLDQILILKEFTDSQFYNLEDEKSEKVEKLEDFKVGVQTFQRGDEVLNCSDIKDEYVDKKGVVVGAIGEFIFANFGSYGRAFKSCELLKTGNKGQDDRSFSLCEYSQICKDSAYSEREQYKKLQDSKIQLGDEFEDDNFVKHIVILPNFTDSQTYFVCVKKAEKGEVKINSFSESQILNFAKNWKYVKKFGVEKGAYDYFVLQNSLDDSDEHYSEKFLKNEKLACLTIGVNNETSEIGIFLVDEKKFKCVKPEDLCESLEFEKETTTEFLNDVHNSQDLKVGDFVKVVKVDEKTVHPFFPKTLGMVGKIDHFFLDKKLPSINVRFSETGFVFAYYPEELEKVGNPKVVEKIIETSESEKEFPKVVVGKVHLIKEGFKNIGSAKVKHKFLNDHIPMKLETYKNGDISTYKVDEVEVSKEEYYKLSKNFKILTSDILENFEVGYGKKIKSKDSNKKLEDTLKSLILKSFK